MTQPRHLIILGLLFLCSSLQSQTEILDSTYMWNIDTISNDWELTEKKYFQYDMSFRRISESSFRFEDGSWDKRMRRLNSYNAEGLLSERITQFGDSGAWENATRYMYEYDSEGRLVDDIRMSWDSGAWENRYRYLKTYGSSSEVIESITQEWSGNTWVNQSRVTHQDLEQENKLVTKEYTWDPFGYWRPESRQTSTYDLNGNKILDAWDNYENGTWVEWIKVTLQYDNADNLQEMERTIWTGAEWENLTRWTFSHGSNGELIKQEVFLWDSVEYVKNKRYYYEYDLDGYQTLFIYQIGIDNQWVNSVRYEMEYVSGKQVRFEYFNWLDDEWSSWFVSQYDYTNQGNLLSSSLRPTDEIIWTTGDSTHNYYRTITLGAATATLTGVRVYPIPSSNEVVFDFGKSPVSSVNLCVYNTSGQMVRDVSSSNTSTVKLEKQEMNPGVYFYKIVVDGQKPKSGTIVFD